MPRLAPLIVFSASERLCRISQRKGVNNVNLIRAARVVGVLLLAVSALAGALDEIEYENGLLLTGHQELRIENATCHIGGEINIEGRARLVIENSKVIFSASDPSVFGTKAFVGVWDNAQVVIRDSSLLLADEDDRIDFKVLGDTCSLELANSTTQNTKAFVRRSGSLLVDNSNLFAIEISHSSRTRAVDSTIQWIDLKFGEGDHVTLRDLNPGEFGHWEMPADVPDGAERPWLSLEDCRVDGWGVMATDSSAAIHDSALTRLSLYWTNPAGSIEDLHPGHFAKWHSAEDLETSDSVRVDLYETSVGYITLGILSGTRSITFSNCDASFQFWSYSGDMAILESKISTMTIGGRGVGGSRFTLDLTGTSIRDGFDIEASDLTLSGDFAAKDAAFYKWIDSTCTRRFQVHVVDAKEERIPGALVEVVDEWGTAIGYRCDTSGTAAVSVFYNDGNWQDAMWLRATTPDGLSGSVSVSILSASPITITVEAD